MVRTRKDDVPLRDDGLQLEEPRRFQERYWTAERWAWAGFALLVLSALAGLTGGGGPLSRGEAELGAGSLDYPRIARWQAVDELTVRFAAGGAERSLTLSPRFAESFALESALPEPLRVEAGPDGKRLVFRLVEGAPGQAVLQVRPSSPGIVGFAAAIDGQRPVPLSTVVLP